MATKRYIDNNNNNLLVFYTYKRSNIYLLYNFYERELLKFNVFSFKKRGPKKVYAFTLVKKCDFPYLLFWLQLTAFNFGYLHRRGAVEFNFT